MSITRTYKHGTKDNTRKQISGFTDLSTWQANKNKKQPGEAESTYQVRLKKRQDRNRLLETMA